MQLPPRGSNAVNNRSSASGKPFWRRRGVLFGTLLLMGGGYAFVVDVMPAWNQLFRTSGSLSTRDLLLAGFLDFTPVIYVGGAIVLLYLGWQTAKEYHWWGIFSVFQARTRLPSGSPRKKEGSARQSRLDRVRQTEKKTGRIAGSAAGARRKAREPEPHVRRVTAQQLSNRRHQKLYGQRPQIGGSRHQTLVQIGESLAQLQPSVEEKANLTVTPVSSEQLTPASFADAPSGALAAALTLTEERDRTRASAVTTKKQAASVLEGVRQPAVQARPPVSIQMLKELTIVVQNDQGAKKTVELNRQSKEAKRYIERELLLRLAAQQGQPVPRERLLENVFAYGLSDERYDTTKMTRQFNKMTQFLREDFNRVAQSLGLPELLVVKWDQRTDTYRLLLNECCVVDLAEVDRAFLTLKGVSGQEYLEPEAQTACQAILDTYRGDFLENYIESYVREGGDDWVDVWVRDFYTDYRDKYFQALWYRAEYWRMKADLTNGGSEAERLLQNDWYERAAKLYGEYALNALTRFNDHSAMIFDLRIKQRVGNGERALRSALDMYTSTGNTYEANRAYAEFSERMKTLLNGRWEPHPGTKEAWKNVRSQTKGHRRQMGVSSHELSQEEAHRLEEIEI